MNAHERREALMGWLRGRVSGTAAEAGGHFGVTERTILRDIDFLRSRGEPISSSSGPGGGFQLDGMARLPAVRLTVEEVLGLALAVAMARQIETGLPYSLAADHAIDRLITTLSRERAGRFRHLMQRITVGWPEGLRFDTPQKVETGVLETFEIAFSKNRVVAFDYTDRHGNPTSRTIEPHGLLLNMPTWYVVAHDRLRDAARMFRVDRMKKVVLLDEEFDPKPPSWFSEYLEPCEIKSKGSAIG